MNYTMRPEVHAFLSNQIHCAHPDQAAHQFPLPEAADNAALFRSPEQMATMLMPTTSSNAVRRLLARMFTAFKTGR